jgi:hypothetical protein
MKLRHREFAKVGVFGSIDNPTIVTAKDLQEIADTFPDIKKAPIKLGDHWSEDRPRLANVVAVQYDPATQTLSGDVEENDVLSQAVDGGYYPDVSIGAKARASDGRMYLHHLAYLGEESPAVKNLITGIAQNLGDAEGVAASDGDKDVKIIPGTGAHRLYLSDTEPVIRNDPGKGTVSVIPPVTGAVPVQAQSHMEGKTMALSDAEVKALQDENERLKTAAQQSDKMLADEFAAKRNTQKEALKKAAAGKIPEPEQTKLLALCDTFDRGRVITLSDGENRRDADPVDLLTEIFTAVKLPVEPGVLNLSDTGDGSVEVKKSDASRMMEHM